MTREYTLLFNGITQMIEELECLQGRLKELQRQAEEFYMEGGEGFPVKIKNTN